jgi:hypothetical protein
MTFWNDFFCFENVGTLLIRQYHYIVPLEYNLGLHQLKYSYYKLKAKSYEPSICQDFCFTFGEFERIWSKAWSNTLCHWSPFPPKCDRELTKIFRCMIDRQSNTMFWKPWSFDSISAWCTTKPSPNSGAG